MEKMKQKQRSNLSQLLSSSKNSSEKSSTSTPSLTHISLYAAPNQVAPHQPSVEDTDSSLFVLFNHLPFPALLVKKNLNIVHCTPKFADLQLSTDYHLISDLFEAPSKGSRRKRRASNFESWEKFFALLIHGKEKRALVHRENMWFEISASLFEKGHDLVLVSIYPLSSQELITRQSRYHKEFIELELIGKGAYGQVFKALNRIDGQEYAIKKVKLSENQEDTHNLKLIQEVKTFATISNHPNVVRYFASWVEEDQELIQEEDKMYENISGPFTNLQIKDSVKSDDTFGLFYSSDDNDMSPPPFSYESPLSIPSRRPSHFSSSLPKNEFLSESVKQQEGLLRRVSDSYVDLKPPKNAVLYIQMQLCAPATLRYYISSLGNLSYHEIQSNGWYYFSQIVRGLAYVHSKGFVHGDLKPENIFVDDRVYLGDFGLAKSLHSKTVEEPSGSSDAGTFIYSSPGDEFHFDTKYDIYALGVIFLELFHPFKTAMERALVLTNIRSEYPKIPEEMERNFPLEASFVKRLIDHYPPNRPSALEITKDPTFLAMTNETEYGSLSSRDGSFQNDERIHQLQDEVLRLQSEVAVLKSKILK